MTGVNLDYYAFVSEGDPRWREEALCAQTDPEAFHPEKGGSTRQAKAVCNACPVRDDCLEFALTNDQRWGVWGGMSERERRLLKRQRRAEAAEAEAVSTT